MEAVLNDGILYIGYANIQGTGMFYSFGGIVAINTLQERATEYLVRPDSETPLSHPKLRLCHRILFFLSGSSRSQTTSWGYLPFAQKYYISSAKMRRFLQHPERKYIIPGMAQP